MHNYRIEYQIPGQEHGPPEPRFQPPAPEPSPIETTELPYSVPPYPVPYQNSDVLLPVSTVPVSLPPSTQTYQSGAKYSTKSSETSSVSSDFSSRSTSPISVNTPDLPLSPPTPTWASRKMNIMHPENNYKTVLSLLPNGAVSGSVNDYLVRQNHIPNDVHSSYPTVHGGSKGNRFQARHEEHGSDDEVLGRDIIVWSFQRISKRR